MAAIKGGNERAALAALGLRRGGDARSVSLSLSSDADAEEDAAAGHHEVLAHLVRLEMLSNVCSPGKMAPMASPLASANDPIFWPLHANFEKHWSYLRLSRGDGRDGRGAGWSFNSSWGDEFGARYLEGWGFHDPQYPFGAGVVAGAAPPREHAVYTNAELVRLLDPNSARLPYVWDDFGYRDCQLEVDEGAGWKVDGHMEDE